MRTHARVRRALIAAALVVMAAVGVASPGSPPPGDDGGDLVAGRKWEPHRVGRPPVGRPG